MTADQLLAFYQQEGNHIFLESVRKQRRWRLLSQLFGSHLLYPHDRNGEGIANVLRRKLIHPTLGSPKMGQITQPHVLIPAYDVFSRNTTWFANNPPEAPNWYDHLELWKICTASASAPTFFPPYELPYSATQALPHIDGGVSANNPALLAIAHVLLTEKIQNINLNDIAVLSIGTGNTTRPYTYPEVKSWGILGWAQRLSDMFLNPAAKNSEDIGRQIMENGGKDYLRLNFDLNDRVQGNSYNRYIFQMTGQQRPISEDIDNPETLPDLIEAAQCYLACGEVDYKGDRKSVLSAIHQFVKLH
jgi:patatin-like phospholipase/acyl hydrolase